MGFHKPFLYKPLVSESGYVRRGMAVTCQGVRLTMIVKESNGRLGEKSCADVRGYHGLVENCSQPTPSKTGR